MTAVFFDRVPCELLGANTLGADALLPSVITLWYAGEFRSWHFVPLQI